MSVRLCYDNGSELSGLVERHFRDRPVTNVLVFFGGFISRHSQGGRGLTGRPIVVMAPLPVGSSGGSSLTSPPPMMPVEVPEMPWFPTSSTRTYPDLKRKFDEIARGHGGGTAARSYDPCMTGSNAADCRAQCRTLLNQAARFVFGPPGAGVFDPRGALIVYGYSAGGFNAVWLCEEIAQSHNWYDFAENRVSATQGTGDRSRGSEVCVDLLVTVDPTIENIPGGRDAPFACPTIVRRHINYYRREAHRPQARTVPESISEESHYVDNRPRDVPSHGMMQGDTLDDVEKQIRWVLNSLDRPAQLPRNLAFRR